MTEVEHVDVVIVGARMAGSAAASALAAAGRHVVALDRAGFPSDTVSTHLLFPGGVAELRALGALERVEALGAPRLPVGLAGGAGRTIRARFPPVEGVDYALCVRRTGLDAALVATARAAGAEVRERKKVTQLITRDGRACGVRYRDRDGGENEIRAPLVIGADGRRSTVARLAGVQDAWLRRPSGRAAYYGYWSEGLPEWRRTAAQWRSGAELGTAFPCDGGLTLVLLQTPVARVPEFRGDPVAAYLATIESMPELAARLRGGELVGKVRSATDIASYFRESAGSGLALAGDAGHFKDPVTAQGIRDALRYGRRLGEIAAPVLDDPVRLDSAVSRWQRERDLDCLEIYQFTDKLARGEAMSPLEIELYRQVAGSARLPSDVLGVYARALRPGQVLTIRRMLSVALGATKRTGDRRALLATLRREVRTVLQDRRERRAMLAKHSGPVAERGQRGAIRTAPSRRMVWPLR